MCLFPRVLCTVYIKSHLCFLLLSCSAYDGSCATVEQLQQKPGIVSAYLFSFPVTMMSPDAHVDGIVSEWSSRLEQTVPEGKSVIVRYVTPFSR